MDIKAVSHGICHSIRSASLDMLSDKLRLLELVCDHRRTFSILFWGLEPYDLYMSSGFKCCNPFYGD